MQTHKDILQTLVSFPSVSGNHAVARAAEQYMADFVTERGMHVQWHESQGFPSFVATTKPNDLAPAVLLLAHIDIVPADDHMFQLRETDGKWFGRGVYDMKSGAAAFLQVIDQLRQDLPNLSLGLMVTADEEIGGRNGAGYLIEQGYRPKVCIIPDGGDNWRIETFEKGVQWIKLTATGIAGHASRPWEGEHAVHKLLAALTEIRQAFPHDVGQKDTILSVGTIKGGSTANQLAESAEAMLDIRTGSLEDHARTIPTITEICQANDVKVEVLVNDQPCVNSLDNPYIASFKDLLVETIGEWPGTAYSYAVTDGRFFSPHGIPSIITMPPGGGWHAADEWVSIEGLQQYIQILERYIRQMAARHG